MNYADDETPSGTFDGANKAFTLAHAPNPPASLQLFWNGILLRHGIGYILNGRSLDCLTAPDLDSTLQAFYRY